MPDLPQSCLLHAAQLRRIEEAVQRIDDTLHGNGQVGLKTLVAQHGQVLYVFKRIAWGLGGAVGAGVLTFVIRHFVT